MSGFSDKLDGVHLITDADPVGFSPGSNPLGSMRHLLSDSSNVWTPFGNTIDKRPGIAANGGDLPSGIQAVYGRTSEAGTLAVTAYHVADDIYKMYYRLSGGSWTIMTDLFGTHDSQQPHEMVWVRNLLYIRATSEAVDDPVGGARFNEDDQVVDLWGVIRPTTTPTFTTSSGWNSSGSDTVDPTLGARYCYSFVSRTGHESCRSVASDKSPIVASKYPELNMASILGTPYVPYINIYRSGDGGGAMFFIEQIANPGVGAFTYEDTNFSVGGNFSTDLDISRPSPTRSSNQVPPPVETGLLDESTPADTERPTPLIHFSGRVFMGVGRNLYYTATDERIPGSGVPEETFRIDASPSANRMSFQGALKDLTATRMGAFAFTERDTFVITGSLKAELRPALLYPKIGVYDRHCSDSFGDSVFWLDQDLQLRVTSSSAVPDVLSGPLNDAHIISGARYQLRVIKVGIYDWVVVSAIDDTTPANTKVFVYDINRKIWFPPWSMEFRTMLEYGVTLADTKTGALDASIAADLGSGFGATISFSLEGPPAGNLLNLRRTDSTITCLSYAKIEWIGEDDDLTVTVRKDSTSTASAANRSDPPTETPVGYKRGFFYFDTQGEKFGLVLTLASSTDTWKTLSASLVFEPDGGD